MWDREAPVSARGVVGEKAPGVSISRASCHTMGLADGAAAAAAGVVAVTSASSVLTFSSVAACSFLRWA